MNNACSWDEENEELAKLAAEIKKNIAMLRKLEQMGANRYGQFRNL